MWSEIDDSNSLDDGLVNGFCQVFEAGSFWGCRYSLTCTAASYFSKCSAPGKSELEWFSRNSYNFAVRHGLDLHPEHLMRLATSGCEVINPVHEESLTSKFINILYQVAEHAEREALRSNQILCEFLSLTSSVVLARAADDLESTVVSSGMPDTSTDTPSFTTTTSPDASRGP
jgi:hypothetical protein